MTSVETKKMMNLKELLQSAVKQYQEDIESGRKFSKDLASDALFKRQIPEAIEQALGLDRNQYLVKGSIGQGGFAQVPWICIFDTTITTKASEGIYVVYLVSADLKTIYLSLNNGVTYFKQRFGYKKGRDELNKVSEFMRQQYSSLPEHLSLVNIDLKSETQLAKSYECGHVLGTDYSVDDLPSHEDLVSDLVAIMKEYERVLIAKGNRSLTEFYNFMSSVVGNDVYSDEDLNEAIEKELAMRKSLLRRRGPKPKVSEGPFYGGAKDKQPLIISDSGKIKYPRSSKVAANALEISGYVCECDHKHPTFLRQSTDLPYTELHHLVLLSAYDDFEKNLDVEENIVSLCPMCHRVLHHGKKEDKLPILKKLYDQRKELLAQAGIKISFDELLRYYGIDEK